MGYRYSIINQCMQLLKESDLPTIKKLRVEILLIQLKRRLLDEELSAEPKAGPCGEEAFEDLLNMMRRTCCENCESEMVGNLIDRMGGVVNELSSAQF
jgi:hypothetical protein